MIFNVSPVYELGKLKKNCPVHGIAISAVLSHLCRARITILFHLYPFYILLELFNKIFI